MIECPQCGGEIVIHILKDEYWHIRLDVTDSGVTHDLTYMRESCLRKDETRWECFYCDREFSDEQIQKLKEKFKDEQRESDD